MRIDMGFCTLCITNKNLSYSYRKNFARSLITDEPVEIANLGLSKLQLLGNLDINQIFNKF